MMHMKIDLPKYITQDLRIKYLNRDPTMSSFELNCDLWLNLYVFNNPSPLNNLNIHSDLILRPVDQFLSRWIAVTFCVQFYFFEHL